MSTVDVYYVKGIDLSGNVVELAKFFDAAHARTHLERFVTRATQPTYREVGIVIERERAEDQHPAHRGGGGLKAAWEK